LATPKDQSFELRLPVGTRDRYVAAIEPIPPQMRGVVGGTMKWPTGTRWLRSPATYRTSMAAIEKENHLLGGDETEAGQQTRCSHPAGQTCGNGRPAPATLVTPPVTKYVGETQCKL